MRDGKIGGLGSAGNVSVTSRIDGRLYAVVNVNAFDNLDPALIRRESATFESEDQETRLARRVRHWIAEVEFAGRT